MFRTAIIIALTLTATAAAASDIRAIPENTLFCPSWAEAHEHSLVAFNHWHPPRGTQWKGCIALKKGEKVDVVAIDKVDGGNEIIYRGKHWFTDGGPFDPPGQ
jgi:hypothetical protein